MNKFQKEGKNEDWVIIENPIASNSYKPLECNLETFWALINGLKRNVYKTKLASFPLPTHFVLIAAPHLLTYDYEIDWRGPTKEFLNVPHKKRKTVLFPIKFLRVAYVIDGWQEWSLDVEVSVNLTRAWQFPTVSNYITARFYHDSIFVGIWNSSDNCREAGFVVDIKKRSKWLLVWWSHHVNISLMAKNGRISRLFCT